MPFVPMMSLHAHGTPVRTGYAGVGMRASGAFACARACSGSSDSHALNVSACAASRNASVSSIAETSRARSSCAASLIVRGRSRIRPLLEARLHAKEVALAVGRLREHDLDGKAGPGLVLPPHLLDLEHPLARRGGRWIGLPLVP